MARLEVVPFPVAAAKKAKRGGGRGCSRSRRVSAVHTGSYTESTFLKAPRLPQPALPGTGH